jgi:hypothetical protein
MRRLSLPALFIALLLPTLAHAAALSINGTCALGNCSNVAAISNGQTSAGNILYNLTLTNGDTYQVTGNYLSTYSSVSGSTILVNPTVLYTGATPSAATDVITLDFFQNYLDNSPGTFDGVYEEYVPLTLAPDTTATAQLFYDGQGIGLIGPLTPGYSATSLSATLSGLTGDTLSADYNFTFTFLPGTLPGSLITSTPEPIQTLPAALALISLALLSRRSESRP